MKPALISKLALFACLLWPPTASADTIRGRLAKMPPPQFTSSKSIEALEWCLGVEFGDYYLPSTIRGEHQAFVYAGANADIANIIVIAALIRDEGTQRTISVHSAREEKAAKIVQSCI